MADPLPRSVYVHVPFCTHRCGYCDFTLVAGRDDLIARYLNAIERELDDSPPLSAVETLFLGGGTPSHLSPAELERLFATLFRKISLVVDAEVSIEANPIDINVERVQALAAAGVNRVSLGIQSFDERTLRTLERDHTAAIVASAVDTLRTHIGNVAFDLIFGVPGQTTAVWEKTIDQALTLEPRHVSTYGLTFEKGTSFWTRKTKGQLQPVPEETEREMYALAMDRLPRAGIEQYELSNFAQPGWACRHNIVYWTGKPYAAFGPGAASYLMGERVMRHRSVTTWLQRIELGESPIGMTERLSPEESAREALILGLRLVAGVSRREFAEQTGFELDALAGETIGRHVAAGLMCDAGDRVSLTREGRFLADTITVDLL